MVVASAAAVTVTALVLPFCAHKEGATTSFVPAMLAIVACFDILSVVMLIGEFSDTGDRRLLSMAWAYLCSLVFMTGYAFAFPGVVSVRPPFAITPSVAPWLYICWHAGFPAMLGRAWAPWPARIPLSIPEAERHRLVLRGAAAIVASSAATVAGIVLEARHLPVVIHGLNTSRMAEITAPVVIPLVILSLISTVRGSFRRVGPERWSSVAVLVCLCDLTLTYSSHFRFSLGWYVGRTMTSLSAGLILVVMLADFRRVKAAAQHNAAYDSLTGLFNRRIAYESLDRMIALAHRQDSPMAAMLVDLDHFKLVNDRLGHEIGDRLLADVARVLGENVRGSDLLARVGGEEFLVVLPDTDVAGAAHVAEKFRAGLKTIVVPGLVRLVSASIGVTRLVPGDTVSHLLRRTDQAMYRAKSEGRDRYVVMADAEPLVPRPTPGSTPVLLSQA